MANEFIARKGLIVLSNGAKITGSLLVSGGIDATGFSVKAQSFTGSFSGSIGVADSASYVEYANVANKPSLISSSLQFNNLSSPFTGSFTGSFTGDGSGLTGVASTLAFSGSTSGNDTVNLKTEALVFSGSNAITSTVTNNTVTFGIDTGSAHFIGGARASVTSSNTTGASGITLNYNQTTGNISASLLTPSASINGTTVTLGGTHTITANTTNALTLGNGLTGTSFNGSTAVTTNLDTGSVHFVSGSIVNVLNPKGVFSSSAQVSHDSTTGYSASRHVDHSTVSITAGNGLTGGGDISATRTLTLDTGSAHFITGSVNNVLNTKGVFSSSAQVTATQISGIGAYATTASNSFTGIQNIDNTTQSTTWTDGALVVDGGVGIAKNLNVSGSVNITGLLTVVSMSTQYVTSSQYIIGDNKIILGADDVTRFGGMSIYDSGSTNTTASIYWDSLNHKFIYENLSGSAYNSAMFIAGPVNTGTLGNEVGLTAGRVPVASGDDHIDSRPASSSIRVDFPSRLTHIEAGLQVTGSISSSVGFSGDGSNLTGIVTNLNVSGSDGGTSTVALKTQALTVSGSNGIVATATGQTITLSGSNATTTTRGVASFTSSNFTVTSGDVAAKPINFNGTDINLGGTYAFGLQNITPSGATTSDQLTLNGGAVIHGVLYTSGSNIDVDAGTEVVATVSTGSYDAAFFDYVIKSGSNYRAGTVMAVWQAGTSNIEFTDTSTNDLGNTSDVVLSADLLTGTARLKATVTTNNWYIKTAVRAF